MRKVSFVILFIFIILGLYAEGLEVRSFEIDKLDMHGSVSPVVDSNGDNCALIRIEHNLTGDVHLTDVEVWHREKKTDKIIYFYISKWEQSVTIAPSEKFLPIKYPFPEALKPEKTYVLRLYGEGEGDDKDNIGVTITTEPAGATVYINNVKLAKKTPTGDFFVAGTYPIRIELDDYQTYETEISILPPEVEEHYDLKPDFGSLEIISVPEVNMDVFLNEIKMGKTPLTLNRQMKGNYHLRAEHEFYVAENQEFVLKAEETKKITINASQNFGTLTINTLPYAKVYLNDEILTKYTDIRLPPQTLNLRAELPKHHPVEKRAILNTEDNLVIDLIPQKITGTVLVTPDPIDASVILNGNSGEKFTDRGISKFADIPIGKYKIEISHPQRLTHEENFDLKENETKKISKTLAKAELYFTVQIPNELKNDLNIDLINKAGDSIKLHKSNNRYLVEKAGKYTLNINKGKNTLYTKEINITSQIHQEVKPYFKTYIAPSEKSKLYISGKKVDEGKNLLLISDNEVNKIKIKTPKFTSLALNDTLKTRYIKYRLQKNKDYFIKGYGIGIIPNKDAVFYGVKVPFFISGLIGYNKFCGVNVDILMGGNGRMDYSGVGDFDGLAIGGFVCMANNFNGIGIGGFMCMANNFNGIGIGGFGCVADNNFNGLAISGVACGADNNFNGLSIGPANFSGGIHKGIQIGAINIAGQLKGIQIGVVNIVKDGSGGALPFFPIVNVHF